MNGEIWYATNEDIGIGGMPILRLDVCDLRNRFGLNRLLADTKAIAVFELYPSLFVQLYGNSYPELDNQLADIMAELQESNRK
jgi:hypothetical protein